MKVGDPHLKLDFTGVLDLDKKIPAFDFTLDLGEADLVAMRLDTANRTSLLKLGMTANFTGDNLDNLDGSIKVSDGWYLNDHDTLTFERLTVDTHLGEEISQIQLNSDFFDLSVNGTYHFRNLIESFGIVLERYLPALRIPVTGKENTNRFAFDFYARDLNALAAVFVPGLQVRTPFLLSGRIDSGERSLEMETEVPEIVYKNMGARKVTVNVEPSGGAGGAGSLRRVSHAERAEPVQPGVAGRCGGRSGQHAHRLEQLGQPLLQRGDCGGCAVHGA